ncbi:MAG: hypothetical protein ABW000_08790 [Actinoplanes sp.]
MRRKTDRLTLAERQQALDEREWCADLRDLFADERDRAADLREIELNRTGSALRRDPGEP